MRRLCLGLVLTIVAVPVWAEIKYQDEQFELVKIVDRYRHSYGIASTALKKGSLRADRQKDLFQLFAVMGQKAKTGDRLKGWIGQIKDVSATDDGKNAKVILSVGPEIFLDSGYNIPKDSSLYKKLLDLNLSDVILFDGDFFASDTDGIYESSGTQLASMTKPSFKFKLVDFEKIEPYQIQLNYMIRSGY